MKETNKMTPSYSWEMHFELDELTLTLLTYKCIINFLVHASETTRNERESYRSFAASMNGDKDILNSTLKGL